MKDSRTFILVHNRLLTVIGSQIRRGYPQNRNLVHFLWIRMNNGQRIGHGSYLYIYVIPSLFFGSVPRYSGVDPVKTIILFSQTQSNEKKK